MIHDTWLLMSSEIPSRIVLYISYYSLFWKSSCIANHIKKLQWLALAKTDFLTNLTVLRQREPRVPCDHYLWQWQNINIRKNKNLHSNIKLSHHYILHKGSTSCKDISSDIIYQVWESAAPLIAHIWKKKIWTTSEYSSGNYSFR